MIQLALKASSLFLFLVVASWSKPACAFVYNMGAFWQTGIGQQAYIKPSNTTYLAPYNDINTGISFGYAISVSGDTLAVGAYLEDSNSTGINGVEQSNSALDSGAVYVFTRSAGVWSQQAYIKASNTAAGDAFGRSVSVNGDTIAVGATSEDSNAVGVGGNQADNSASASGAVYVFARSAGVWSQQAYIKASNTEASDNFGVSVALSADTLAVGASAEDSNSTGIGGDESNNLAVDSGAVYVFARSAGVWSQQAYIKASNAEAADGFGSNISLSGDSLAVNAAGEDSNATGIGGNQADNSAGASGAAYVFTRTAGVWSQQAYIKASNTAVSDAFGFTLSIDSDTLAVSATGEDSNATGIGGNQANNTASASGAVYVFTRAAGVWSQQAYIKASNTATSDTFGRSVSVSSDTLAVGAIGEDSIATGVGGNQADNSASASGAAYVFTRAAGVWSQQAYIKASNTGASDSFAFALSVDGDTLVSSANLEDSSSLGVNGDESNNSALDAGAAYAFTRTAGVWSQQAYLKASNTAFILTHNPQMGFYAVSLSGDSLAVGALSEDSNATGINGNQTNRLAADSGAVYIFSRTGSTWSQQAYIKASNAAASDAFGTSVSLDGDTLAVGATGEDSNATGIGGNQADNSAGASGAVYVFTRTAGVWSQEAYIKASNTAGNDFFGTSVSLDNDTLAVSATGEDSNATGIGGNQADNSASASGAVYVFTRAAGVWSQQAYIKASNTGGSDGFGITISLDGETLAVGANGEDSNATGIDGNQADNTSLTSGAAYVFTRAAGVWTQQAYVKASNTDAGDNFGLGVSVSGDLLVVGAYQEDSAARGINGNQANNSAGTSGAAYIFSRSGGNWSQEAYVKSSNSELFEWGGYSVSVKGNLMVMGVQREQSCTAGINGDEANNSCDNAGAAYLFSRSGAGVWKQEAYIKASNPALADIFARTLSIDGKTLAVGAMSEASNATGINGDQLNNSAPSSGAVYVYDLAF